LPVLFKKIKCRDYKNSSLYEDDDCRVFKLSEAFELSPFFVVNENGKEHIISGLGYLLLPSSNITVSFLVLVFLKTFISIYLY